jgi:hypothetical protein
LIKWNNISDLTPFLQGNNGVLVRVDWGWGGSRKLGKYYWFYLQPELINYKYPILKYGESFK